MATPPNPLAFAPAFDFPRAPSSSDVRSRNIPNLATLVHSIRCAFLHTWPHRIGGRRCLYNDPILHAQTFIASLGKVGLPTASSPSQYHACPVIPAALAVPRSGPAPPMRTCIILRLVQRLPAAWIPNANPKKFFVSVRRSRLALAGSRWRCLPSSMESVGNLPI